LSSQIQVNERGHLLLLESHQFEAPRTLTLKEKGYTTGFELSGRKDHAGGEIVASS